MELKNFKSNNVERCALHELYNLCKQKYHVSDYKFKALMDAVESYCIEKNETSFESFIKYMIRSKLLKPFNITYDQLIELAKQTIDEFEKILKELDNESSNS